jgi:alpha-tubulin suppressor-like RCC1 family protein
MSVLGPAHRRVARAALTAAVVLATSAVLASAEAQTPPLVFQSISAGTNHTCAITPQHVAYCWGRNAEGELGNPTVTSACSAAGSPCSTKPVRVEGGLAFAVISAGNNFTCGVTTVGTAYCWGAGAQGQLGTGNQVSADRPERVVSEGVAFLTISAGYSHACAVARNGSAYCWGSNAGGRLGTGASLTGGHTTPALVAGGLSFRTISAGYFHTCGVTRSGATYCWGRNEQGETGNGATAAHGEPARIKGDFAARAVSAAVEFDFSCAVGRDSGLFCWGANCYGQLGVDSTSEQCGTPAMPCSPTPVAVHAAGAFQAASAFFSHVCALGAAGEVSCWGGNNQGQLGNGNTAGNTPIPAAVVGGGTYTAVTAGRQFSCAIATGGAAQCWGENAQGQLGTGDTQVHTTPTPVVGP